MKINLPGILNSLFVIIIIAFPVMVLALNANPVSADGGPWVSSDLWSYLTEGQQIAVISADGESSASVDLFISILDQTNESHEISFFLPLGTLASDFYVTEQHVNDFSQDETHMFDDLLDESASSRHTALTSLFAGSVLANGYVLAPLWAPILLSSCGSSVEPTATYHTASSDVSIYDVTEDTDINELSAAAGLPDGVRNTLAQLRGQQIAVVKLRTRPQSSASSSSGYYSGSEPGLHFSWKAELVSEGDAKTLTYSLGTGGAWSKPIEMTRVYIFAPTGMDFRVEYPKLGSEQSGYAGLFGSPRIADYYQVPAYAVDEARGDFGRLWRITYTQSNPTQDIKISFAPQTGWSRFQSAVAGHVGSIAFFFALIMGPLLWMLAWIIIMPRFTRSGGKPEMTRWYHGLIYTGINAVMVVFPGTILMLTLTLGLVIPSLAAIFVGFGGMSVLVFWLVHAGRMGISKGRALGAFFLTGLASNAVYLALALVFARVSGII